MNIFYRIIIYIIFYYILQQVLILNAFLFLQNPQISQNDSQLLINEFRQIMHYFTFSYIIVIIILDYFTDKKRAEQLLKKGEITNEN